MVDHTDPQPVEDQARTPLEALELLGAGSF